MTNKRYGMKWCCVVAGLVLATGCFSSANVKGKHAKFHGCDADSVTVTEVESEGHTRLDTSGCGADETYYCVGMKCRSPRLLSISHFGTKYKCDEQKVKTQSRGENTFELSGCGEQANYTCKQVDNHVIDCRQQN